MNKQDIQELMDLFHDPGTLPEGGVTRLAYGPVEDEMHGIFRQWGENCGFRYSTDAVGNSFLCNDAALCVPACPLVGSHLDSVIKGGRFDGVAGVVSGMVLLKWLKESGSSLPLRVGAFRCEESSGFGRSTVGSGLITHTIDGGAIADFRGKEGKTFREVFAERGLSLYPPMIDCVSEYLELHIEQGKVLESLGKEVGIVEAIAGPRRYRAVINGFADHSGATPMDLRKDAMAAAAELILAVEAAGRAEAGHKSVATVGIVKVSPGVMNVIPGQVELGIDTRGIDTDSIDRMETAIRRAAAEISETRGVAIDLRVQSEDKPARMNPAVRQGLTAAAGRLGISHHSMASGAGHDALGFAERFPAGMIFIPCRGGVSHNPAEYTTTDAIFTGARVLFDYLLFSGSSLPSA